MTSRRRRSRDQSAVDRLFDAQGPSWRDVYDADGLHGLIYRRRMDIALGWIDELGPPAGATALEVGTGAGLVSAELSRRGLAVTSTDASQTMIELTAQHVQREGVADGVHLSIADAHDLPFGAAEFDLVVALGVLPWLYDAHRALTEMTRVLRPGGLLVVSADNRWRLNSLAGQNPALRPLKALYHLVRPSRAWGGVRSRLHSPPTVDRWLRAEGVLPARRVTVGFGPLTVAGRPLLSPAAALRLHMRLQALSDRGSPVVRWTGWHYLVAARKVQAPRPR